MLRAKSAGTRLLNILFASDGYAQLRFEDGMLLPRNPLTLADGPRQLLAGEAGYGDGLVSLIGQVAVREVDDHELKLRFEQGGLLSVSHWVNDVLVGWDWSGQAPVVDDATDPDDDY